jgi:hypothetical protein
VKIRNKHIYSKSQEYLVTIKAEFASLGFDTILEDGHLIVLSRRRKKVKKKDDKARDKSKTDKPRRDNDRQSNS